MQMGVVRFTERHLHHDPPEPEELQRAGRRGARGPRRGAAERAPDVRALIAVAGTATRAAAIAHERRAL